MPLKISEIGVRMAVHGPHDLGEPGPKGGAAGGCGGQGSSGPSGLSPTERDALLDDCVRLVLETLRRQEAR